MILLMMPRSIADPSKLYLLPMPYCQIRLTVSELSTFS